MKRFPRRRMCRNVQNSCILWLVCTSYYFAYAHDLGDFWTSYTEPFKKSQPTRTAKSHEKSAVRRHDDCDLLLNPTTRKRNSPRHVKFPAINKQSSHLLHSLAAAILNRQTSPRASSLSPSQFLPPSYAGGGAAPAAAATTRRPRDTLNIPALETMRDKISVCLRVLTNILRGYNSDQSAEICAKLAHHKHGLTSGEVLHKFAGTTAAGAAVAAYSEPVGAIGGGGRTKDRYQVGGIGLGDNAVFSRMEELEQLVSRTKELEQNLLMNMATRNLLMAASPPKLHHHQQQQQQNTFLSRLPAIGMGRKPDKPPHVSFGIKELEKNANVAFLESRLGAGMLSDQDFLEMTKSAFPTTQFVPITADFREWNPQHNNRPSATHRPLLPAELAEIKLLAANHAKIDAIGHKIHEEILHATKFSAVPYSTMTPLITGLKVEPLADPVVPTTEESTLTFATPPEFASKQPWSRHEGPPVSDENETMIDEALLMDLGEARQFRPDFQIGHLLTDAQRREEKFLEITNTGHDPHPESFLQKGSLANEYKLHAIHNTGIHPPSYILKKGRRPGSLSPGHGFFASDKSCSTTGPSYDHRTLNIFKRDISAVTNSGSYVRKPQLVVPLHGPMNSPQRAVDNLMQISQKLKSAEQKISSRNKLVFDTPAHQANGQIVPKKPETLSQNASLASAMEKMRAEQKSLVGKLQTLQKHQLGVMLQHQKIKQAFLTSTSPQPVTKIYNNAGKIGMSDRIENVSVETQKARQKVIPNFSADNSLSMETTAYLDAASQGLSKMMIPTVQVYLPKKKIPLSKAEPSYHKVEIPVPNDSVLVKMGSLAHHEANVPSSITDSAITVVKTLPIGENSLSRIEIAFPEGEVPGMPVSSPATGFPELRTALPKTAPPHPQFEVGLPVTKQVLPVAKAPLSNAVLPAAKEITPLPMNPPKVSVDPGLPKLHAPLSRIGNPMRKVEPASALVNTPPPKKEVKPTITSPKIKPVQMLHKRNKQKFVNHKNEIRKLRGKFWNSEDRDEATSEELDTHVEVRNNCRGYLKETQVPTLFESKRKHRSRMPSDRDSAVKKPVEYSLAEKYVKQAVPPNNKPFKAAITAKHKASKPKKRFRLRIQISKDNKDQLDKAVAEIRQKRSIFDPLIQTFLADKNQSLVEGDKIFPYAMEVAKVTELVAAVGDSYAGKRENSSSPEETTHMFQMKDGRTLENLTQWGIM